MILFWTLTACLLASAPPVEVTLLNGETRRGTLEQLGAKELSLQPESGAAVAIPAADLLEVRLLKEGSSSAPPSGNQPVIRVGLVDGSKLQFTSVETTSKELTGQHSVLGSVKLPLSAVRTLRFASPDAKLDPLWQQLLDKPSKNDQIVRQKQEILDHFDGVVGAIDPESIKFLIDGDEISVKREKAFGIIYARKPSTAKLAAQIELQNGDLLSVKSITADQAGWKLESASGFSAKLPWEGIARADFSLGKVVYLSSMEPRSVKYTDCPQFPDDTDFRWEFRRDRSLEGKPLRLGQKTYSRGLAIHSKTELKYRLGGEFRRLQALLGVDDEISRFGAVSLRILGDREELYAADFRPRQTPVPLDLDVAQVVELEIIVDFGADNSNIGDRLHLADARLVK